MSDNEEYIDRSAPDDTDLAKISNLAREFVRVSSQVRALEEELDKQKKLYGQISEFDLPEAMNKVHMKSFTLNNGYKIAVQDVFNVRLSKGNTDKADVWLDANGHSGMIKTVLQVELPKDITEEKLGELLMVIDAYELKASEIKTVHWATIQSWGNEMKENGEIIPEDIFSVFRGNRTVITE